MWHASLLLRVDSDGYHIPLRVWLCRSLPPLLVKVSPDLTDAEYRDVATACISVGIDGIIVSNTTVARPQSLQVYVLDRVCVG